MASFDIAPYSVQKAHKWQIQPRKSSFRAWQKDNPIGSDENRALPGECFWKTEACPFPGHPAARSGRHFASSGVGEPPLGVSGGVLPAWQTPQHCKAGPPKKTLLVSHTPHD